MATTTTTRTIRCTNCGQLNRTPATAEGTPRCGNCHAFLPWITDATDENFTQIAEQPTIPVLVDLWATWCTPCRTVSPALEQLATEHAGQLKLVKVDIDHAPQIARRFSIQTVPTLMILHHGQVLARQPGAAPVHVLRQWLDEAVSRIPANSKPTSGRAPEHDART
jgi:thioredoxin 2